MRRLTRSSLAAVALSALVAAAPAAAAGPSVHVLASGLDDPRGLAVGTDGRVFVAEAGRGGPGGGYGTTGRITVIDARGSHPYLEGLPSAISDEGEVTGPVNVALNARGNAVAIVGAGPQAVDARFGSVLRLSPATPHSIADIAAYQATDPDPTDLDQPANPIDSNPYGAAWLDGSRLLIADAGGNDLLLAGPAGRVTTVARFPNQVISTAHLPFPFPAPAVPAEAVPTSVAIGPDGYWYVGELKGFPFTPGTSRIWRVAPWARGVTCDPAASSGACTLFADGFTSVVGLSFGPDGSLYVAEMVSSGLMNHFAGLDDVGALWRLRDGVRSELVAGQLILPGGVAAGRDGTLYVTTHSVSVVAGSLKTIH
jgi:hypothetical protein